MEKRLQKDARCVFTTAMQGKLIVISSTIKEVFIKANPKLHKENVQSDFPIDIGTDQGKSPCRRCMKFLTQSARLVGYSESNIKAKCAIVNK